MRKDSNHGGFQEFSPEEGDWRIYTARFRIWVSLCKIPPEKQTAALLCVIGPKTYSILRLLAGDNELTKMTVDEINKCGSDHFCPKGMKLVKRYRFGLCAQGPNESFQDFATRLEKECYKCNYGRFTEDVLRDAFILKINDPKGEIRQTLFMQDELTFREALRVATVFEEYEKKEMEQMAKSVKSVSDQIRRETISRFCYRCGSTEQLRNTCPNINARCTFCERYGHTAKVCRLRN
ncbi:hypothetical protein RF11_00182 [Thelohanellus kitauei]|uniref:CCHC-type domain-containing protein n=1 Tax=Thelohanellus kitauei TaxID=669202 RepID=A0A0C2N8Y9_THEKT|nr:hypothetical protein RF11_00182 [Thelohanellus kitauei]